MRKIYILLMIFLLSNPSINIAQNFKFIPTNFDSYYFTPRNLGFSTPQTADFVKYGNIGVNHYHGLLDLEIPLTGHKDRDFNIPMSLRYISEGFKPQKRPSLVGYNWILNIGGVITREVNNSPDDVKGKYTENGLEYMPDGLLAAIRNGKFRYYDEATLLRFGMEKASQKNSYPTKDFSHDYEPDIFNFNFGNYQGSFIIGNNGKPVSLSGDGYLINIDRLCVQEYSTTNTPQSSEIEIITPDGYKYIFGGNESFLEYSIPNNPKNLKVRPVTIVSWHLKKIEAPNKRFVDFTYQKIIQPNKYKYYVSNYSQKSTRSVASIGPPPNIPGSSFGEDKEYVIEDKIYLPTISSIVVDNTKYEFNYSRFSWEFFGSGNSYDTYYLNSIITKYNNTIRKTSSYTYTTKGKYFFLKNVLEDDRTHEFDYHFDRDFPDPQTNSTDHWGFWNGSYSISEHTGNYLTNIDVRKAVNISVFNTGLLKKIIYPTKGITEIEYEYNRYNHWKEKDNNVYHYNDSQSASEIPCGGARVKNIKDYDPVSQKISNSRSYSYRKPNSKSGSGVIGLLPKYKSREEIRTHSTSTEVVRNEDGSTTTIWYDYYSTYINDTRSSNTLSTETNLSEYHIGYSDVTETLADESRIHYNYSSLLDVSDHELISHHFNDYNDFGFGEFINHRSPILAAAGDKYGLYKMNDMSRFRGKLQNKTSYSSNGIPILTEIFKYNLSEATTKSQFSITSLPRGVILNRIFTIPCKMIEHKTVDSENVIQTLNYKYNSKNLVTELKTTNSDLSEYTVNYKYPFDYPNSANGCISELIKRNMVSEPISVTKTLKKNGSNDILFLDAIKFDYQIMNDLPLIKDVKKLNISAPININSINFDSDTNFEIRESYTHYDDFGNPVHVIKDNSKHTTYLWGYKGQHLIAEIKDEPYNNIFWKFGYDLGYLSQRSNPDMAKIRNILNPNKYSNTLVSTYSYLPLVGMLQSTDTKGQSTYYSYDKYGRLKHIKDNNQDYLNEYKYHYANNTISNDTLVVPPIQTYNNPLSFNFMMPPTDRYNTSREPCYAKGELLNFTSGASGGSGNYIFELYVDGKTYKSRNNQITLKSDKIGKKIIYPKLVDLETGEKIEINKVFHIQPQEIGFSKVVHNGNTNVSADISCFETTDITFLITLESPDTDTEFQLSIGGTDHFYTPTYNSASPVNKTYYRVTETFNEGTSKIIINMQNHRQSSINLYIERASNGVKSGTEEIGLSIR